MKRVYAAAVFIIITLIAIMLGGIPLSVFIGLLVLLGNKELIQIIRTKGFKPSMPVVIACDILFIIVAYFNRFDLLALCCTGGIIAAFITIMKRNAEAKIADVATTVLAFLYGGFLPAHIILLRNLKHNGLHLFGLHFRDGFGYLILIFFIITISDIAAYYVGKNFGKHKLSPIISPKKTIEGAVGATIGGVGISVIIGHFIGLSIIYSLIGGLLLSVTAQFGDLAESMMKRDAGIKDSGTLIPGHGGILDRADSYIFTVAVAYYYFSIIVIKSAFLIK